MRDRQDLRAIKDGANKQEFDGNAKSNSPDEPDELKPLYNSNLALAMDSDEGSSSVTLSLSKAIGDATITGQIELNIL